MYYRITSKRLSLFAFSPFYCPAVLPYNLFTFRQLYCIKVVR